MKYSRIISLLLVLVILSVTACGGDKPADDAVTDTQSVTDTETETVNTEEGLDLPDNLTSEYKEIYFLSAEGILASADELTDEMDVLAQAMYERTAAIEERFGIELKFTDIRPWQDTSGMARQFINAGSDEYQFVFTCASHMVNLVDEGLFLPHSELPYINIEKPWWNKQYIESVSLVADEPYILFGDITYNTVQRTCCVFFNVPLLEEKLNMVPRDLYDLVYDGKWTIDKLNELVSKVYEDANGNTKNDYDDVHGMVYCGTAQMGWLAFSSGLDFTTRDEDGYPMLSLNNEASVDLTDKLLKLLVNNPSVYREKDNLQHVWKFSEGTAVFLVNRFYVTGWDQLRTMEEDYGVLPMPKYSEDIDGYHSAVESLVQWGGIPVTVSDPVFISAVAEALAYESRLRTTPAYYETTLKLKQTRDEASMEMIDMIMAGRDTDYLYINPLGGMNAIFDRAFNAGFNNFASQYASLESAAATTLSELIATYEENH